MDGTSKTLLVVASVAAVSLVLFCGLCSYVASVVFEGAEWPSETEMATELAELRAFTAAEKAVRDAAKHPDSVKFDSWTQGSQHNGDTITVAGDFTAKNAFGMASRHSYRATVRVKMRDGRPVSSTVTDLQVSEK